MTIKYLDSKRIVGLSGDFKTTGLKAYYQFEESSGNIINQATSVNSDDSLGTNADGINNGSFAYQQAGKIDYGVALSDSSDYVELGTSLTQWQFMYAAGCKYTLTMWYKPSVTLDSGGFSTLFSNFGSANSEGVCISVDGQATTANRTRLYITSESNGTRYIDINADFNNVVDDTNWHFIAVRFDGTSAGHSAGNNYEVSFDGGSWQTWSSSSLPTGSNNSNTSMRLGNDGFSRNLEGNIDETSIWNKILTDAEITTIYNSGTGKKLQDTSLTGSKPTNIQDNSILVEKDTANRFWFSPSTSTSSQTSTDDAKSLKAGNRNKVGQQFNTGHSLVGSSPTKATFYLSKGGTPPNNVTAHIRNSSGTLRENSTTTIVADNLTGSAVATDFTFAGTTTLATGDMITVEYNSGDSSNYVNAWIDTSSAVTNSVLREYTSSWSDVSGQALKFDIESTTTTWNMEPTFEDDFSTDNATDIHSANIGVTGGRWEFDSKRDGTNDSSALDLVSALSDTAWVMDFDFFLNTVTNGNLWFSFGLSDNDETSTNGTSQESIYVSMGAGGSGQDTKISLEYVYQSNMVAGNATASRDFSTSTADSDNTTHYCRLTRTSATSATLVFYTTAARTTVSETLTMSDLNASVNGLRYIVMRNHVSTSGSGTLSGYVDNIKVYNGVTSV